MDRLGEVMRLTKRLKAAEDKVAELMEARNEAMRRARHDPERPNGPGVISRAAEMSLEQTRRICKTPPKD